MGIRPNLMRRIRVLNRRSAVLWLVLLGSGLSAPLGHAQVASDGSLGKPGDVGGGGGATYEITPEYGRTLGDNLFHSFSRFDLQNGQIARFVGPAHIRNVLGRVTSGSRSALRGQVGSSISGANIFLLNPAGFIVGARST